MEESPASDIKLQLLQVQAEEQSTKQHNLRLSEQAEWRVCSWLSWSEWEYSEQWEAARPDPVDKQGETNTEKNTGSRATLRLLF